MKENKDETARFNLSRRNLLKATAAAGVLGGAGVATVQGQTQYDFDAAAEDASWYSQYNADAVVLSENGVLFPRTEGQRQDFDDLRDAIRENAGVAESPIRGLQSFTIAPFLDGDPSYTERPVFNPRLIQNTLVWQDEGEQVLTPKSVAWPGLMYVQWARAADELSSAYPNDEVADYWAQVYGFTAQWHAVYAYLEAGQGVLRDQNREEEEDEDELYLYTEYDIDSDEGTQGGDEDDLPTDYGATLWYFSQLTDFAARGPFGYENPQAIVGEEDARELRDHTARTIFGGDDPEFSADEVLQKEGPRGLGLMLSAVAQYSATAGGNNELRDQAEEYANNLASLIIDNVDDDGEVFPPEDADEDMVTNQAALQGAVGQGLTWASTINNVDQEDNAEVVLDFLFDELWRPSTGTFDDGRGEGEYVYTAQDLGDVVGGINVAESRLRMSDAEDIFPVFFNNTVNRAEFQRAERSQSRDAEANYPLPLPQNAGGENGQAPVLNAEVTFNRQDDAWEVTDESFNTEYAMYTTNQLLWIGSRDGQTFPGGGLGRRLGRSGRRNNSNGTDTPTPTNETTPENETTPAENETS